jgi:ectoine hydroxylase-related dioxygenase (phytanoyl-CoA dioxygenase family)
MDEKTIAAHVEAIDDQGYTLIENAFDADLADVLSAALLNIETDDNIKPADNLFEGANTVRIYNLLARDPSFQQVPIHDKVLPVVEGVLDDGCLISSISSIAIAPGETPQPIHADDQVIGLKRPHKPVVCNSMWALTDFTEENGATRLVPGSHKYDRFPEYGPDVHYESIPAEMKRGSVLVWNGSLWHGGGANTTDKRRVGLAMNYCAGFIRQQENQQLGIPLDIVKTFPHRLQNLCGFGTYQSLIGHIDKMTPAQRLLGHEGFSKTIWDES